MRPPVPTGDLLRRVYLRPYRKGRGPTFTLRLWATSGRAWRGQTTIAYELRQHDTITRFRVHTGGRSYRHFDSEETAIAYCSRVFTRTGVVLAIVAVEVSRSAVLFTGADFHGSPLHADDSNATVGALLVFLTLRPGDTDREYFDHYTEAQRAFADQHAEVLACCDRRFQDL